MKVKPFFKLKTKKMDKAVTHILTSIKGLSKKETIYVIALFDNAMDQSFGDEYQSACFHVLSKQWKHYGKDLK